MPLESLELTNFGAFEKVKLEFCPGINVLIGPNSTGKTHLMKAAYATLRVYGTAAKIPAGASAVQARQKIANSLHEKLIALYRPDDGNLGRLVRRAVGGKSASVCVRAGQFEFEHAFDRSGKGTLQHSVGNFRDTAIFLPSRELLAIFEGFAALYEAREIAFDETYYDACKALSLPSLRGVRLEATKRLAQPLVDVLGGQHPRIRGGKFYLRHGGADMEAHLLSEGLRKLAAVVHLVDNGELRKRSVLFWDEPEANLNPGLLSKLVEFLVELAKQGVQIIFATHDYLLAHRVSRVAEHGKHDVAIRFFSFFREGADAAVQVERGGSLLEIEHNPLLDELARFQHEEVEIVMAEAERTSRTPGGPRRFKARTR